MMKIMDVPYIHGTPLMIITVGKSDRIAIFTHTRRLGAKNGCDLPGQQRARAYAAKSSTATARLTRQASAHVDAS